MSWIAVAAVVGTGIAGARASSKASKIAERGAERSGAQILAAGQQARGDVQRIFPQAQGDILSGAAGAGDILSQGVVEQQRLLSAGNVGAQQTLGQGFGNIQAALLGTPINQQAFAPQGIELSQPLQNPLGQALGGGQVEGGLFSDLGANVEKNRLAAEGVERVDDLVARAAGGGGDAVKAQEALIAKGFNFEGQTLSPSGKKSLEAKILRDKVQRLVVRANSSDDEQRIIGMQRLRALGFDRSGKPKGKK